MRFPDLRAGTQHLLSSCAVKVTLAGLVVVGRMFLGTWDDGDVSVYTRYHGNPKASFLVVITHILGV